ncbi:hypothetical protein [Kosakonia sacchari]|uniref:hypothetical protein n=1 Tax=Kosakonia sacchari TaxID=1158459 RepID=UPI001584852D|nr:hypothetical protein [Kosakonia sacchari]NUL36632.1 hypothetical protein [Kosakonia sacchari]
MQCKVIFSALIDGKKENLDAVFTTTGAPSLDDKVTAKAAATAAMLALSSVIGVETPKFTVVFNLEAVLPVV